MRPEVVLVILLVVGVGLFLAYRKGMLGGAEHYGGLQRTCEDQCFASQYYDYCMDVCLNEGSTADFNGRAEEYAIDSLGAPIPLDEGDNTNYVSTFAGPYRYDYPGH
jgi:hypothetical protein